MKFKLFIFIIFGTTFSIGCDTLKGGNKQQYQFVRDKNEEAFCRKYWGENLISCLQHCNNDEYKANLLLLDGITGQRAYFFEHTLKNSSDYKKLDEVHEDEKDWQRLWTKLSKEEKEKFFTNPNTLLIASSKANLEAFIKEKKVDEEFWEKVYLGTGIGLGVVVIVGGGVALYYYGPSIIASLPSLPSIPVYTPIPVPV